MTKNKNLNLKLISALRIFLVTFVVLTPKSFVSASTLNKTNAQTITCGNKKLNVEILKDDSKIREVRVTNGKEVSTVIYNKLTQKATLNGTMTFNLNNNNSKRKVLGIPPVGSEYDSLKNTTGNSSYAIFHGG
ncbi:hypothetical protein [Clostridium felsineum]|uniref:hypothetical protein n=1 Tax=Clostridium felsineum TaxID=36839 RepID=UPI00098C7C4A|nr:hypothetical protein [Clostridium felsineum]URZ00180.1 hypothetical protein CLAUR_001680 [Clostridium felsineum]